MGLHKLVILDFFVQPKAWLGSNWGHTVLFKSVDGEGSLWDRKVIMMTFVGASKSSPDILSILMYGVTFFLINISNIMIGNLILEKSYP